MDNIKHYLVLAVVVVAVVFGVAIFQKPPVANITVNVPEQTPPFGATPGTDIDSPYLSRSGNDTFSQSFPMTATSSILCALQNPFRPGTTTIDRIVVERRSSFVGATSYDISTSTQSFASSTRALTSAHAVGAGNKDTFVWTPRTASTSIPANINELFWDEYGDTSNPFFLTGNDWLTVRVATGTPGRETLTGDCSFEGTKTGR